MTKVFKHILGGTLLSGLVTAIASAPAHAYVYGGFGGNPTEGWNDLWHELLWDIGIIGTLFGTAALIMLFAYKAKNPNDHGSAPTLSKASAIGWALIPAAIFMADDFFLAAKGWALWNIQRTVPADAMEVKVRAERWAWEFDYGNGLVTDTLAVPVGQNVVLRMTSADDPNGMDVIHSFGMPHYRMTEDVMPGRTTYVWFRAEVPYQVEYNDDGVPVANTDAIVTCREFCGEGHSAMYSEVQALSVGDFNAWMAEELAAIEGDNVEQAASTVVAPVADKL